MKRQVQQTELAFLNPPQQRGKARYMSVDALVAWGGKVLEWLNNPRPTGRDLDEERVEAKLAWLRDYREPLQNWQQAMSVIGTVESLVRQEGYHAASAVELAERLPTVEPDSLAERLSEQLTVFVGEQVALARAGERLPGSSEVLESMKRQVQAVARRRGAVWGDRHGAIGRRVRRPTDDRRHSHRADFDQRAGTPHVGRNAP